jgi:hypothetical protein
MAIMLREFVENSKDFAKDVGDYDGGLNLTEGVKDNPSVDAIDPDSLMVEIEGIHAAPFATRNYTRYTAKCLKNSVPSWTEPYRRPLIKHHNEENGEPIGRIISAEYVSRGTRSGTPALKFTVNVPDKQAKENIKNGLLSTASIGAIANDVRCSICGKQITSVEEGCPEGHQRGFVYTKEDGTQQTCYWDIYDMEAKEISYVDVPSDMYAKNINIYPASKSQSSEQPQLQESLDQKNISSKGEEQMAEPTQTAELKEAKAKVSELEAKVTELTEANKTSEGKVAELTESKKSLDAKVTELEESNKALDQKVKDLEVGAKEAAQLKESMEKEIAEAKAGMKESLTQTYVMLREALGGKVADVEVIKNRSVDSLKDSIMDMKESLTAKAAGAKVELKENADPEPEKKEEAPEDKTEEKKEPEKAPKEPEVKEAAGSVKDPTLKKPVETTESAEKKKELSMDLEAGLEKLFGQVISAHNA